MNAGSLQQHLAQSYSVLCCVDLADVSHRPDQIYKLFAKHYKSVYADNERLVLYSQYTPDQSLLDHIHQAAWLVDISNFFILLCCPGDLANLLSAPRPNCGPKQAPIQHLDMVCESRPVEKTYQIPEKLCALPFVHLEISQQGKVRPCCVYKGTLDRITNSTVEEIFYSEPMNQLRDQFRQAQRPTGCQHCWQTEAAGHTSIRQANLSLYEKSLLTDLLYDPQVRSLDLKPSNVCNLKCRICDHRSSSAHVGEILSRDSRPNVKNFVLAENKNNDWFDQDQDVFDQIVALLPQIQNIDFYGGEPFLLKNLKPLLTQAVTTQQADHIRMHFNTNGTVYPEHVVDLFCQFKHVDIAISADNLGTRFEYERGGLWSAVETNIVRFQKLPQVHVYLYVTVNIQNVYYLDELYAWAQQRHLKVVLNFLNDPWFMSIDYLTDQAKNMVISKYQHSDNQDLQNIASRIAQSPGSNGEDFRNHMQKLDNWRDQQFVLSHFEIATAMGSVLN